MNKNKIFIFAVLFSAFVLFTLFDAFSHVRGTLTDRLYTEKPVLDNIAIIAIDDTSINNISRWPWSRDIFAKLLSKTKKANAIGIDVSFFEKSDNDNELANILKKNKNIILAAEINEDKLYKPIFDIEYGFVNIITDNDGITRKVLIKKEQETEPFAFKLYKKAWNPSAELQDTTAIINFGGKTNLFKTYSAIDVINNNHNFTDKILLIGATAPNLHDTYFVPTSRGTPMSGVEIHATILQNLIRNEFLTKQSKTSIILLTLITSILGLFFISKLHTITSLITMFSLLIIYALTSIFVFTHFNYLLDLFFVPLALLIFTSTGTGINYYHEKKENKYLTTAFGKYISNDLLQQIIAHKHNLNLGGTKTNITIFFSDIRGFTTISEKLGAEQLVSLLNEYLTAMTTIILKHHGTVDKFIGDAIMAFWNAPLTDEQHAENACRATIAQIKELKKLQPQWAAQGYPQIDIGCGLNTGEVVVGNMGSNDRFDYTAMGDTVNLGSRLEGLTKTYGAHIIISETTHTLVKEKFKCRKLDAVKVKGKKIPVNIYE
ncbi:adenylate/guanylate cyclase domain-containing protein, partial [Candidatus Woesearchaeota archaeon]|nr:adenylate/guanylate cyclase domain-containing protein [Candidatus Woesearchaeota archaeon]